MQVAKSSFSHFHPHLPIIRPHASARAHLCKSLATNVSREAEAQNSEQLESMGKRARKVQEGPNGGQPSAVGVPNKKFKTAQEEKNSGNFRFWHDERRFKSSGAGCLVQQNLYEAGGVRTGGYPRAAPIPGALGHQRMSDWDMLWSPARLAIIASATMKPGQLVSACPGLKGLTSKSQLSLTLKEAHGEKVAFRIVPRTFALPDEVGPWKSWLSQHQRQGLIDEALEDVAADGRKEYPLWILKTAQHLGKGLKLLPADEAVVEAGKKRSLPQKPFVAVQQYVDDPLLINGCKFGVRVWVLVTGFNPLRVYMHVNGLALFSTHSYDNDSCVDENGSMGLGHVTNYAQNLDGAVWSLDQLKEHLGDDSYNTLWSRISKNTADVFAAALKPIKTNHKLLKIPPGGTFELLGLDYLVDSSLHPWLLEVNGTPSLAVDHCDPIVERMIFEQKNGMVKDMVKILDCSHRFLARYTALKMFPQGLDAAASASAPPTTDTGAANGACSSGAALADEADGTEGEDSSVNKLGAKAALAAMTPEKRQRMAQKLKEQLCPTTDTAVLMRVKQELLNLGGFEPLMPLFTLGAPRDDAPNGASFSRIPWDARDYALRELMKFKSGTPK